MGHPHVQRRHAAIHKFLIILSPHLPRKYPEFLTSCPCTRRRHTHKLLTKPSPRLPRKYSTSFRHTIPALAADNSKHISLHRELGDPRLLRFRFHLLTTDHLPQIPGLQHHPHRELPCPIVGASLQRLDLVGFFSVGDT